ncbi:guanine deaminase [Pseudomonadota bacterium]
MSKSAVRGSVLSFSGDPFLNSPAESMDYFEDAIVVMEDGEISELVPASAGPGLADGVCVDDCTGMLILPGFIDCHVHYPQVEIMGAYGKQLMDWLEKYTFVAEQKFADPEYGRSAAKVFLRECLRAGTTTSAVFCTVHPQSVDVFFEESEKLNMRNIAGKVLMDRNAPSALCDTAQSAYDQSKQLIERWHGRGRQLYAVTPRFAATSSPAQLEAASAVWKEHHGTYLQSHLSENTAEIEWVMSMYPECSDYVDVYRRHGLLGERSIYGHGIHLSESELRVLHETGATLAHCPTSNLFLGSGSFDVERTADPARPVRFGLATDLGAGTNFSQLVTMNEAYKVAQLNGYSLSASRAFYLATLGAARALYLDDRIGTLSRGSEADLVVLDPKATPLLEYRMRYARDIEETLFVLMTLGDDRAVHSTWVAGRKLYSRDSQGS